MCAVKNQEKSLPPRGKRREAPDEGCKRNNAVILSEQSESKDPDVEWYRFKNGTHLLPPSDEGGGICVANDGRRDSMGFKFSAVLSLSLAYGSTAPSSEGAKRIFPFLSLYHSPSGFLGLRTFTSGRAQGPPLQGRSRRGAPCFHQAEMLGKSGGGSQWERRDSSRCSE